MTPVHQFLSTVAFAALSASTLAATTTTTYTSSGAFLANVQPGFYTEDFTSLGSPGPHSPISFSSGGFSYTISAPGDLYASGFLGTNTDYDVLTIAFTSGNVTAVGANFYPTLIGDVFFAAAMNIVLNDGTNVSFTPGSANDSYRGFTSDQAITSLTLTVSHVALETLYAGLDNLTVGGAVPEPTSVLLAGLGLAGLLVVRRRSV